MGINGNGGDLFAWNFKKLSERAAKYTAYIYVYVWYILLSSTNLIYS